MGLIELRAPDARNFLDDAHFFASRFDNVHRMLDLGWLVSRCDSRAQARHARRDSRRYHRQDKYIAMLRLGGQIKGAFVTAAQNGDDGRLGIDCVKMARFQAADELLGIGIQLFNSPGLVEEHGRGKRPCSGRYPPGMTAPSPPCCIGLPGLRSG